MSTINTTVPGLDPSTAQKVADTLAYRLVSMIDLQLVLKHVHWNVIGREFLTVHEMLDEQVAAVRDMSDELAERIATLGAEPNGNPGHVVERRTWDDYEHGRTDVDTHLAALDSVYTGIISDHRQAISDVGSHDVITEDLLIAHTGKLEMFQWFIRSFRGADVFGDTEA